MPKKWLFLRVQKLTNFIRLKKFLKMREYASFIEMKNAGARGTAARGEGRKAVWHRM